MTRFNIYDAGIKVHPEAQAKCITTAIVLWYQSKHTEAFNEEDRLWYGIYLSISHIQKNTAEVSVHSKWSKMSSVYIISYWLFSFFLPQAIYLYLPRPYSQSLTSSSIFFPKQQKQETRDQHNCIVLPIFTQTTTQCSNQTQLACLLQLFLSFCFKCKIINV